MPKMKGGEEPEDVGGPTPTKDANQAGKPDAAKKVKKDTSDASKSLDPRSTSRLSFIFMIRRIIFLCLFTFTLLCTC